MERESELKRLKVRGRSNGEWAAGVTSSFYDVPGVWNLVCMQLENVNGYPMSERSRAACKAQSLAFIETFLNVNQTQIDAHNAEVCRQILKNAKLVVYIFLEGRFESMSVNDKFDVLLACGFNAKYLTTST